MKRLAQITLTIFATLLGLVLLWEFRPALELFGGSLALSATLRPLVKRLEDRGVRRGYAILLWYVLMLALLGGAAFLFGVGISSDIARAIEGFPTWYAQLREQLAQGGFIWQTVAEALPDLNGLTSGSEPSLTIGGNAVGLLGGIVAQIVILLAMLSLAFYWLSEVTHFERLWLSLLPVGARIHAREIWRNAETAVGAYIRSTLVAVVCSGVLLLGVYSTLTLIPGVRPVPFAALLALAGGLSHLVPRVGPAFALLISVALTAVVSPISAGIVFVAGIIVHVAAHDLAARMMNTNSGRVNPLLQVLLLLALAELGGATALLFAPPLAALVQVLYNNLRSMAAEQQNEQRALDQLAERLQGLEARSDPEQKEFLSALRRSNELIAQARVVLDET